MKVISAQMKTLLNRSRPRSWENVAQAAFAPFDCSTWDEADGVIEKTTGLLKISDYSRQRGESGQCELENS